jgi:hypothetical protein
LSTENLSDEKEVFLQIDLIHNIEQNVLSGAPITDSEKKLVQRVKDNISALGYEIIDYKGKKFNDGMLSIVIEYVPDETNSLNNEEDVIIKSTEPQINLNGKMVRAATIKVVVGNTKNGLSAKE